MARALGRTLSDKEQGIVVSQVRKYSFIRAKSLCLLNRLCFLGEVAVAAAGRRDLRLEEGRRRTGKPAIWPTSEAEACLVRVISLSSRWMLFVGYSFVDI